MAHESTGTRRPAIFIDRDGVVIEMVDYLNRSDQVVLVPGVAAAIAEINRAGIPLIMVTNQSGIARGLLTEAGLHEIHARLHALLAEQGARIDALYYCPHHPSIGAPPYRRTCDCRKPAPGMLLEAAHDLDLDLARSVFIGDHVTDIEAGHNAGVGHTVLVLTGHGKASAELLAGSSFRLSMICTDAVSAIKTAREMIHTH
jgi:D-glycero-D-manno-heptose 1,7-bisphosphate phosphatase